MTLKLIDKDLKSKYAEVLYKNHVTFDKELDRRFRRLSVDFVRSSRNVDNGSLVFLNRVRQKREKWIQDDLNYREHYRYVCRNATLKKLENLRQALNTNSYNKRNSYLRVDPILKSKINFLNEQLSAPDPEPLSYSSEINFKYEPQVKDYSRPVLVPKLPSLKYLNIDEDLYSKYSKSDRDFLAHFPGKIELENTKIGKRFVESEQNKLETLQRQTIKNEKIQTNAINDPRFDSLMSKFSDNII